MTFNHFILCLWICIILSNINNCINLETKENRLTQKIIWGRLIAIWGPFEKFVDSLYYSESELCGGAVTVSLNLSTSLDKRCTSYNAPPTSRKRAADSWWLRNFLPRSSLFIVGKAQKSHGAKSELNSVFGLEKVDRWNPIRTSAIQSRSRPTRFLGFTDHVKGAPGQEISKWSTVCSTFSRRGWSVVGSASLAKGGTSKKETVTAPPQSCDSD
jgi:hypothetical protein